MSVSLFERVVLLRDLPEEGLRAGDVGTIVERHPATGDAPEGYEVEFFAANGGTVRRRLGSDGCRPTGRGAGSPERPGPGAGVKPK